MEQQMRFCTGADGMRIAYGTVGRGLGRQRRPQAAHRYRMMES